MSITDQAPTTASPARIIWLASYPKSKSGNTWFRIFLANLLHPEQAPVNLNALPERTPIASCRGHFDDLLGVPSALLTQAEIDRLRPAADVELARVRDEPLLLRKAHDGYNTLPDGRRRNAFAKPRITRRPSSAAGRSAKGSHSSAPNNADRWRRCASASRR